MEKSGTSLIYISKRNQSDEILNTITEYIKIEKSKWVKSPQELLVNLALDVDKFSEIIITGKIDGQFQNTVDLVAKAVGEPSEPLSADEKLEKNDLRLKSIPKGSEVLYNGSLACGCIIKRSHQKIIFLPDNVFVLNDILQKAIKNGWFKESVMIKKEDERQPAQEQRAAFEPFDNNGVLSPSLPPLRPGGRTSAAVLERLRQEEKTETAEEPAEWENQAQKDDDEEERPQKKKLGLLLFITFLLLALIIVGAVIGYDRWGAKLVSDFVFNQTRKLYQTENTEEMAENALQKFGLLQKNNSDIGGFVKISGTNINHPVMISNYKSEEYYQKNCFFKFGNRYGTPYLSSGNKIGEFNKHFIIYGSSIDDQRVFADLKKYKELDFYKKAPVITFDHIYGEGTYKIFAVCIIDETEKSNFNFAAADFQDEYQFNEFVSEINVRSLIQTEVFVRGEDDILTLTTGLEDFDGARILVVARKLREGETEAVNTDVAALNENPVMPLKLTGMENTSAPTTGEYPEPSLGDTTGQSTGQQTENTTTLPSGSSQFTTIFGGVSPTTAETVFTTVFQSSSSTTKTTTNATTKETAKPSTKPTVKPTTTKAPATQKPSTTTKPATKPSTKAPTQPETKPPVSSKINIFYNGKNQEIDRPLLVARVLQAEMGSSFETEALKAQAVAIYSYLNAHKNNDGTLLVSGIAYSESTPSEKCLNAAKAVDGEVMMQGGSYLDARFYAMSAGKTAWGKDVWGSGSNKPYLISVDSSVDKSLSGFSTTAKIPASEIAVLVQDYTGIDLTKTEDKSEWIKVKERDANNLYVNKVLIGGTKEYSGQVFRYNILKLAIRSHCFEVSYNAASDSFVFNVKGYGHGVGLSQRGANEYAKQGKDYQWILSHYYNFSGCGAVLKEI